MILDADKYGPFAPVVGYGSVIMASGLALFTMWAGTMKKWRPPAENLPGAGEKMVLLLCGVCMVIEYFFAEPSYLEWMVVGTGVLVVIALILFLRYAALLGTYGFWKPVPGPNGTILRERILGGHVLRPEAEEKRSNLGVDEQTLLEGAAFNVDLLWDRRNLQWVSTRVLVFFILTLVFGTSSLTAAGFTTQVILTQKAAHQTIDRKDAPGLGQEKTK